MIVREEISRLKVRLKESKIDDVDLMLEAMLKHIGSVDAELRDALIYPTFMKMIDEELLTPNQFHYLFDSCLDDNHLFYKIGEENTDSVFTRSFSALVLAGLLYKDRDLKLLTDENFRYVLSRGVAYLESELDTRGFVEEKGWAHSVAHGADLLVAVVKHPNFKIDESKRILKTIQNCLLKDATYIDEEDERLVFIIEALFEKYVDESILLQWIHEILNNLEEIYSNEGFSNRYFRTKFNITSFLKSLYFIIGFKNEHSSIRELINRELKQLHHKMYG
ncbi:DUF2785 domain-containing protein [Ureibacillus chungkukjangi]|uniref:DUF2785 domain-containing protein n=1 Tax=Ureibacillus chungkukjangi TaxID=1202712 RepID=UPI002041EEE8|nr:DUF2785 domain-containing protein [Ureibacillus chungkukjangi]MCM3388305.1 DUF2785 domain-containing protein [Ureibacillus chungkukjangi]